MMNSQVHHSYNESDESVSDDDSFIDLWAVVEGRAKSSCREPKSTNPPANSEIPKLSLGSGSRLQQKKSYSPRAEKKNRSPLRGNVRQLQQQRDWKIFRREKIRQREETSKRHSAVEGKSEKQSKSKQRIDRQKLERVSSLYQTEASRSESSKSELEQNNRRGRAQRRNSASSSLSHRTETSRCESHKSEPSPSSDRRRKLRRHSSPRILMTHDEVVAPRTILIRQNNCRHLEQIGLDGSQNRESSRSSKSEPSPSNNRRRALRRHSSPRIILTHDEVAAPRTMLLRQNSCSILEQMDLDGAHQQKRLQKVKNQLPLSDHDYRRINRRKSLRSRQ